MGQSDSVEMDRQLFELLQANGRRSNRDVGQELGISPKLAGSRIKRLLETRAVRIAALVDTFSAGFDFLLAVGVTVNSKPAEVAKRLAQIPNMLSVIRMAGQYDIECLLAAENHGALSTIVQQELSQVHGVRSLHPSLVLEVLKYRTGIGAEDTDWPLVELPSEGAFDDVDRAILHELWKNAREPNEAIANALHLSESTVRSRVAHMRREDLMHITALSGLGLSRDSVFAFVGLELDEGSRSHVVKTLTDMEQVGFVAIVLGRYDVLAQVVVDSAAALADVLTAIGDIAGVRNSSCAQALDVVKYDYRWTMLRSRPQ